ncbi:hypothetical protein [Methylomonas sp. UP202]|uniref:hypothetical protein n=1 Tax=Methylomonas sp. UP202 TaxID=3040943 RepID=UPI00247B184A|nr:hypothetical protein [Methylomonas sp. UP202]WGS84979.1 hypothetical protein QC632_18270 [Methylomonas sp. UP202]
MQTSKKAVLDQIEFHVASYQRTYANVGNVYYEYTSASAYVHSLKLLFQSQPSIVAACESASGRIDNIFLNGDPDNYSRRLPRAHDEQTDANELAADAAIAKLDRQSEPVALATIQGDDFEETLTELDFGPAAEPAQPERPDPLKQVDWTEQLPALPEFGPSSVYHHPVVSPGDLFIRHIWSMAFRPKRERISRIPQASGGFDIRRPLRAY